MSTLSKSHATEKSAAYLCHKQIDRVEAKLEIPKGLLTAIAITESGKKPKHKEDLVSWPWVLNVDGKPEYHSSKTDAVLALKRYLSQGIRNIDVGCMQINYRHHGKHFRSPSYMLDPRLNVLYAGEFLVQLHKRFSSWTKSVGYYHSGTLKYQVPYRQKVYKLWREIRGKHRSKSKNGMEIDTVKNGIIRPKQPWIHAKPSDTKAEAKRNTHQPVAHETSKNMSSNQKSNHLTYGDRTFDDILHNHPHPNQVSNPIPREATRVVVKDY